MYGWNHSNERDREMCYELLSKTGTIDILVYVKETLDVWVVVCLFLSWVSIYVILCFSKTVYCVQFVHMCNKLLLQKLIHHSFDILLVLEMGGVLMARETGGENMWYLCWHLDISLWFCQRVAIVFLVWDHSC